MLRALEWGERQAVDQRADDFGAVHGLAVPGPYVFGEAIEVVDLAVEEHHRYLGPCLVVHGRAAGTGFPLRPRRPARPRRALSRCSGQSAANYTWRLLV